MVDTMPRSQEKQDCRSYTSTCLFTWSLDVLMVPASLRFSLELRVCCGLCFGPWPPHLAVWKDSNWIRIWRFRMQHLNQRPNGPKKEGSAMNHGWNFLDVSDIFWRSKWERCCELRILVTECWAMDGHVLSTRGRSPSGTCPMPTRSYSLSFHILDVSNGKVRTLEDHRTPFEFCITLS